MMTNRQRTIEKCYQIPGQMWPTELGWLYDNFATSLSHVEVGTYCGRSLMASCGGMARGASVLCVDPDYSGLEIGNEWIAKVRQASIDEMVRGREISVRLVGETSLMAAHRCYKEGLRFDTCFIDGNHNYAECRADIEAWRVLVRPGGLIAGHDYWPVDIGVMDAVNEVFPEGFEVAQGTRVWMHRMAS